MAKQPQTIDRYRVHCEVDSDEAMGRVVGQLTRMGFANVGFELITDIRTYNKNSKHEINANDAAMEFIKDHPTFKATELVEHFRAIGRGTGGGAYATLSALVEKGELTKNGPGMYQRADVKALAPPAAPAANSKGQALGMLPKGAKGFGKGKRFEIGNKDLIWKTIKGRKSFTYIDALKIFKDNSRNPKSVSSALYSLTDEGKIKAKGGGNYEVLKAKPATKPATKPANGKSNNGKSNQAETHTAATETVNG